MDLKLPGYRQKQFIRFLQQNGTSTSAYKKKSLLVSLEYIWAFLICAFTLLTLLLFYVPMTHTNKSKFVSPMVLDWKKTNLKPLTQSKKGYEVFGFAPYWTINKLDNVDFSTLTTFSYFGVPVDAYGNLQRDDQGYLTFISDKASDIFKKAHATNTRVVLTVTQMDNYSIASLLDNPDAQANAISQIVTEVKNRGIDGVNVDFEYVGDPGDGYRTEFTNFVSNLTDKLHQQVPNSKVTVSVYALSVRDPKLYNIASLAKHTDGIFMMAYDFAGVGADNAMPTAPLYGYNQGKYPYDVSTAVNDFLKVMPSEKLILGVPYYGYNYLVYQPQVNSQTLPYWTWKGQPMTQTYSIAQDDIQPTMDGVDAYTTGWDAVGDVGYKAYHDTYNDTWRMIFVEDTKSLGMKYDFAKNKNLAGIGIWALGFDDGKKELWALLRQKFGEKLADSRGANYGTN